MSELSPRMEALVEWMDADCAADIGCDHAYVICEAVKRGRCAKGYACDIAAGPLSRAQATIAAMGLDGRVIPRLQNGVVPILPEVSLFVIAGMGGSTIQKILEDWLKAEGPKDNRQFLLSPHSDAPKLRVWLSQHGFDIQQERILQDERHWYPILKVVYRGPEFERELSEAEAAYGRHVVPDEQRALFLQEEHAKLTGLLERVPDHAKEGIVQKLKRLETAAREGPST